MSLPSDWKDRHLWQIQPVRDVLFVLAIFAVIVLGGVLSLLTVPLLLALLFAYLFDPIITRLTGAGGLGWFNRSFATGTVIAAVVIVVVIPLTIGLAFGIVQAIDLLSVLGDNATTLQRALTASDTDQKMRAVADLDGLWESIYEQLQETERDSLFNTVVRDATAWISENRSQVGQQAVQTLREALTLIASFLAGLGAFVFQAFLTGFFFFFISVNYRRVLDFFESLIPSKNRKRAVELVEMFDAVVAAFVRGRLTIALIQSVFFIIGYSIVGVPAAVLVGIGSGIVSIVPYLSLVSLPVAIGLIYIDPPMGFRGEYHLWMIAGPIVIYQIAQLMDDYVLTPVIQGKGTNLDTPTVLFSSIAGGILAGVYGLLIAIPVAACIKILIREVLWPKIDDWLEGRAKDPLPIDHSDDEDDQREQPPEEQ
jgi:predicted PurR-regulated permease PerM